MFLRKVIFSFFIIVSLSYALFASRGVLFAPRLEIFFPQNGAQVNSTRINVSGKTIPNASVWAGGATIQSDDSGFFEDFLTFHPGYNEIGFSVKNRFGKETKKAVKFVIK